MLRLDDCRLNMDDNGELHGLPSVFYVHVIDEVAKNNGYQEYSLNVRPALGKGENFFGELFKVHITGRTERKEVEEQHWILKRAPDNEGFRNNLPVHRYFCREISAYTSVLPNLIKYQSKLDPDERFDFVKCYVACNEEYNEVLVLDDMTKEGYKTYDRLRGLNCEHMSLVVQNLARFHATSFVLSAQDPIKFNKLAEEVSQSLDYGKNFEKFINQNKNQILSLIDDPDKYKTLSSYLQDMEAKLNMFVDPRFANPYNVICHGDCWTNNLLFKYKGESPVRAFMIDWQVIRLASPVTDLAYVLYTSTDQKMRSEHLNNVLDLYYSTLKHNITKMGHDIDLCYPRVVFDNHIRAILPFGLLISITLCPVLLCDRDQTPDLAKANEQFNTNNIPDMKFSKTPSARLKETVDEFIKLKFI